MNMFIIKRIVKAVDKIRQSEVNHLLFVPFLPAFPDTLFGYSPSNILIVLLTKRV